MPLSEEAAAARANELLSIQSTVREKLDPVRRYWKGRQRLPAVVPNSAPPEVREMARISRINVCEIVVTSMVQSLIMEGIRAREDGDDGPMDATIDPVWEAFQANRWDKRQSGVHGSAVSYGNGYTVVLPGRSGPVVRGVSPRRMTALYGDDPDWPTDALERRRNGMYVLYDEEAMYRLKSGNGGRLEMVVDGITAHGMSNTPVVRYDAEEDLDEDDEPTSELLAGRPSGQPPVEVVAGQVAQLTELQDQIDVTTFGLLVAQWYTAHRKLVIMGWSDASRETVMKQMASEVWAFKDHPDDMRIEQLAESSLDGYIKSREHTLKYAATLSQTPVHELIGQMINMAAEALAAAEAGRDRKVDLFKLSLGEGHLQTAGLIGELVGAEVPDDAQIVWRDTSARAFTVVVQGLAMLANQLGVPPQELWDRIPGATQQEVRSWKAAAAQGDSLAQLTSMLDRQAGAAAEPEPGSSLLGPDGEPIAA